MVRKVQSSSAMRRAMLVAAALAALPTLAGPRPAQAQTAIDAQTMPQLGELFVITYRPGPAWRDGVPMRQQGLGPHGAYMQRLLDEGRLFAAGGFVDDNGGMAIVRCADRAEAEALVSADPAVRSEIFVGAVEHWRPRFRTDAPLPRQE